MGLGKAEVKGVEEIPGEKGGILPWHMVQLAKTWSCRVWWFLMLRSVPSWVPAVDVFEGNVGLSSPADVANP